MVALDIRAPNSLVQLLLQSGADPHLSDAFGRTLLYRAAMERNVWAIKWLIAENVDLETSATNPDKSLPVLECLLDLCDTILTMDYQSIEGILNCLRAVQVLALAGTNHVGKSFSMKQTQAQLIERFNLFVTKSVERSKAPRFRTYEMVGGHLKENLDVVQSLVDMFSNPLSLKQLCRFKIRKSLGREFHKKLHQLNMPLSLQEYLMIYKPVSMLEQDQSLNAGLCQKYPDSLI